MQKITDKIHDLPDGQPYFSLEFFPPKTPAGAANLLPRLVRLARLRPLFVTITWGAGGSTASKSLELAETCQVHLGLTTCLHLTCTNMKRHILDAALDKAKALGVRNLLALRGDEPRPGEYKGSDDADCHDEVDTHETEVEFQYAADLVRYIRKRHGNYFCIGVAAYPEGHTTSAYAPSQSPVHDLPYLIEKTKAGADFIMTQLFYDAAAFLRFEQMLRNHESGVFKSIPIIPGLMPIQSWQILTRTTTLSCAKIPKPIKQQLETAKGDDELVKTRGVEILTAIIRDIKKGRILDDDVSTTARKASQGFHFYTLNLEKAVARVLEACQLIPEPVVATLQEPRGDREQTSLKLSSDRPPIKSSKSFAANSHAHDRGSENGVHGKNGDSDNTKDNDETRENPLAISEGEGSLGREATWDDFPNGRWGDARSPAYGSIDGYGPSLHVSPQEALKLWSSPKTRADISTIFRCYLKGEISAIPWSEESLSPETHLIQKPLLLMNEKNWWTMASQPAVNGARSGDEIVGWGPKVGGFVWQKPFVEFFLPSSDWGRLRPKLDGLKDQATYFAGNGTGEFVTSDESNVCPVTWGAFKGKEIITPTIIEAVSFRAWQEEAFGIWREWERLYAPKSVSSRLLHEVHEDVWLVNVIGHVYQEPDELWNILLG